MKPKCAKEEKLVVVLDYHIMKTQTFPVCVLLKYGGSGSDIVKEWCVVGNVK